MTRAVAHKGVPAEIYKNVSGIMSKAYQASRKVLEENKKLGIPSPFSVMGKIYYLMPDGRIVSKKRNRKASI